MLTTKELATILDVDEETIRRWVRRKKLQPSNSRVSRKDGWTFSEDNVKEFVEANGHIKYKALFNSYMQKSDPVYLIHAYDIRTEESKLIKLFTLEELMNYMILNDRIIITKIDKRAFSAVG